ncbi:hypothetical protein EYF80_003658 [Liparis tanakae]|uniref:Uncharacterized protein n=1 Tax=Liparis tanakae TaxID=230148 RepID=A0A4Z2J8K6_9TELE|nr:hypothetical protein EYF80_003658 [Liparis tanakae]
MGLEAMLRSPSPILKSKLLYLPPSNASLRRLIPISSATIMLIKLPLELELELLDLLQLLFLLGICLLLGHNVGMRLDFSYVWLYVSLTAGCLLTFAGNSLGEASGVVLGDLIPLAGDILGETGGVVLGWSAEVIKTGQRDLAAAVDGGPALVACGDEDPAPHRPGAPGPFGSRGCEQGLSEDG